MGIGIQNLGDELPLSRAIAVGIVAPTGSTTSEIALVGVSLGNISLANGWALLEDEALGANAPPTFAEITSNTANVLTLTATLSAVPASGYRVWMFAENTINVVASENIAQVNGAPSVYSSLLSPNTAIAAPAAVSVGTAAVRLDTGLANRRYITIVNNGTASIYVGGSSSVTTANGLPVAAGASATYNLGPSLALYGISTATQDVRVLEVA